MADPLAQPSAVEVEKITKILKGTEIPSSFETDGNGIKSVFANGDGTHCGTALINAGQTIVNNGLTERKEKKRRERRAFLCWIDWNFFLLEIFLAFVYTKIEIPFLIRFRNIG